MEKILKRVAKECGEKPDEILRAGRKGSEAKQVAVYLLKKEAGMTLGEIGQRMGVGFSAVGNQWAKAKEKYARDEDFRRMVLKCKM